MAMGSFRRSLLILGAACTLCSLDVVGARATTLCFDDAREVTGAQGHSCCLGGVIDSVTAPACGARRYSCVFEDRCELTLKGSSSVRIVDATTAVAVPTRALLWAPHRCCADGTVVVRAARDVTAFAPQPLECALVPGCRVELELASKYASAAAPELAVADTPWSRQDWEMFVVCTRDGGLDLEICADEWLLAGCDAAICELGQRDALLMWLEKVTTLAPTSLPPVDDVVGDATLFTSEAAACCVAGSAASGPFYLGGALHAVACTYDSACTPRDGDMLYFGDAEIVLAKSSAWSQIPARCEAELAARDGMIGALEQDLAAAEARTDALRATLEGELADCRADVAALENGTPGCPPTGGPVVVAPLVVAGDSAQVDLLADAALAGAELIVVSPPTRGIAVWQSDGLMTYFPNPGFAGTETLFYQVRDAAGRAWTSTLEVQVP